MTKQEFIDKLKISLSGKVSGGTVQENVIFYDQYFNGELAKGRTEQEICETLGPPEIVAKGILAAEKYQSSNAAYEELYDQELTDDVSEAYGSAGRSSFKSYRIPGWLVALIALLVFVLIFWIIISVFSALAPILLPLLAAIFLWRLFQDHFRNNLW